MKASIKSGLSKTMAMPLVPGRVHDIVRFVTPSRTNPQDFLPLPMGSGHIRSAPEVAEIWGE
jgi:hypothetical protein